MKKAKMITVEQLARDHGEPSQVVKAILANYRSNVKFKFRKGLVIDVLKTRARMRLMRWPTIFVSSGVR